MSGLIFDCIGHYLFKFLGVCVLFALGRIIIIFRPGRQVYSFKEIWTMQYDARDEYWICVEEFSQKLIGFAAFAALIITAIKLLA